MEDKFIVQVTEKRVREVVVSASSAEEAKLRGIEALKPETGK